MNGHEGNRSEQANGNSSRDPDAVTRPENIDSLPPNVHCARIRSLQKLIRYAETRIRYQQELIDIETFDQRDTDAAQLQSYIHAKGATELDCNLKLDINNRKELPENTIPVNNPFSVLTIDDDDMEVAGSAENNNFAQPKVKPIMLKFNKNFNLILQHLNRKYPDSVNKLTGEYIKITAANIDQHGEITNELKEKASSNTDIDDIKYDLANQGLPVMKVAQLTQRKSKNSSSSSKLGKTFRTVGTYAILALAALCPLLGIRSAEGQAHRSATTATISIRVH
ncbi:hypothetical protein TNCV_4585611 [Trichonephila clavipes]|nr:hypothetical protein TNCV_4585611 [Trichonephila clavipes]